MWKHDVIFSTDDQHRRSISDYNLQLYEHSGGSRPVIPGKTPLNFSDNIWIRLAHLELLTTDPMQWCKEAASKKKKNRTIFHCRGLSRKYNQCTFLCNIFNLFPFISQIAIWRSEFYHCWSFEGLRLDTKVCLCLSSIESQPPSWPQLFCCITH